MLTVSWPPPVNINFLVAYRVSYITSSARSRRQMLSTSEVPAGMTSTTLPFMPFMNFTVDVVAIYDPPPSGNRVIINLLPPTTFMTPQRGLICGDLGEGVLEAIDDHDEIKQGNG